MGEVFQERFIMSEALQDAVNRKWWAILIIPALITIWILYQPGLSGTFHFDDHQNLGGLQTATDFRSSLLFVATNESGPLGRPIAIASFLLEKSAYPDNARPFLRTNLLLHIINSILVFLLATALSVSIGKQYSTATKIGIGSALLWALLPLHSATVFLVIVTKSDPFSLNIA